MSMEKLVGQTEPPLGQITLFVLANGSVQTNIAGNLGPMMCVAALRAAAEAIQNQAAEGERQAAMKKVALPPVGFDPKKLRD